MNPQTQSSQQQRPMMSDWTTIKTLTNEHGHVVEVQRLNGKAVYRYSLSGTGPSGTTRSCRLVPLPDGTMPLHGEVIGKMIDEAILAARADRVEVLARKQAAKPAERDRRPGPVGPSPLGSGMTPEKRAAKKARHEANQAARRAADAEFRNKARGK